MDTPASHRNLRCRKDPHLQIFLDHCCFQVIESCGLRMTDSQMLQRLTSSDPRIIGCFGVIFDDGSVLYHRKAYHGGFEDSVQDPKLASIKGSQCSETKPCVKQQYLMSVSSVSVSSCHIRCLKTIVTKVAILKQILPERHCVRNGTFFGLAVFVVSDQRNALEVVGQTLRWRGCSPSSDPCPLLPTGTHPHPSSPILTPSHTFFPPKYHPVDRLFGDHSIQTLFPFKLFQSSIIFHLQSLVETYGAAHILSGTYTHKVGQFHQIPASYL